MTETAGSNYPPATEAQAADANESSSLLGGSGNRRGRRNQDLVFTPGQFFLTSAAIMVASFVLFSVFNRGPKIKPQNRIGKLPFMGYNTWNAYHCNINETVILEAAHLIKKLGLHDAGYEYVNIDDCYSELQRNKNGDIIEDKARFAGGMKKLTKEVHSLGLKTGIYSDAGWKTCAGYPGSYGNEERDIKLFQDWGFDLLKYDNCNPPFDGIAQTGIMGRYERMKNAIDDLARTSGKPPIFFSMCEWGNEQPWLWAGRYGQTWRTTGDIIPTWKSISTIIAKNQFITQATDFYGHNDMDMLEVGNGHLTYAESKSHFTAWALMKSPLQIGTHLARATKETVEILTNPEIIAINQDPVYGKSIAPFRFGPKPLKDGQTDWSYDATHPAQYWSGESQNGVVFMLLNVLDEPADLFFNLTESPWVHAGKKYNVRDLWSHTDNGTAVRNFTAYDVPPHGVVALLLTDAGKEPDQVWPCARWHEQCMDKNGTVVDG